jgi:hypothetical protein
MSRPHALIPASESESEQAEEHSTRRASMQVVYERCCGLDVHKRTVVACVLLTQPDGSVQREVRTFSTMTAEVLALDDWLRALQVQSLAMESSGVFWHPVYNLLEEGRTIILVHAQRVLCGPRSQDGHQGQRVVGGFAAAWAAQGQFHSAPADPRVTGSDPLSQDPGPGTKPGGQSAPEAAGGGQYQAGRSGDRRGGQEWTR